MKRKLSYLIGIVVLAALSAAQSEPGSSNGARQGTAGQASATPSQSSNQLPAGTIISAELSKSLDAKKAKTSVKIEAKVPADVLLRGKVVVPRNTKIIGHVAEVKAHSKESPGSMVGIVFERIAMKDGRELPIQVVVQAVGRPLQLAALSSSLPSGGADMPSGTTRTTAGGDMGASIPPRSSERVAAYPPDLASGRDAESPATTVAPLGPTSQGVIGMKGLALKASGEASVISSETDNVHLDSGTQLILRIQ